MQRFVLFLRQAKLQIEPPILLAIGMLIGSAWYFTRPFEPDLIWLSIAVLASGGLLWFARRDRSPLAQAAMLAFAMSIGALSGGVATKRTDTVSIVTETQPVWLEGWIETALPAARGKRLEIRVHAIDGLQPNETPSRIRLTHSLSLNTEPGRFVRCWAVLRPPPAPVLRHDYAFDLQAWFDRLGAVGYVQGRCQGAALGAPVGRIAVFENWIATKRRQLARYVDAKAGARAGGFAAALASGDRSLMPLEDQDALRGSGLAHLLAISGLHMGIVGGLVFLLCWRLGALIEPVALRWNVKKPAALIAITACLIYLILSGASVSTQRAFIMASVFFGAVLIDRTAVSLRTLSIAMILVLLLAPWSVLTPGFQMSFAATGALIACYERWQQRTRTALTARRRRSVFWIQSLVVTSTVSGLATLPYALYHFGRAASGGFIANLLAMPFVSLVSAPAAAAALILTPIGLDGLALRVFGGSLEAVLAIAHFFSGLVPDDSFNLPAVPSEGLILSSAAIVSFSLVRKARTAWVSALSLMSFALVIWIGTAKAYVHWAPSGDLFFETAIGEVYRAEVFEGAGLSPLRFKDKRANRLCQPGDVCQISYRSIDVIYDRAANQLTFTRADGSQRTISWAEIVQENGVTLVFEGGGFKKLLKPKCGQRPWRPCRPTGSATP